MLEETGATFSAVVNGGEWIRRGDSGEKKWCVCTASKQKKRSVFGRNRRGNDNKRRIGTLFPMWWLISDTKEENKEAFRTLTQVNEKRKGGASPTFLRRKGGGPGKRP